MQLSTSLGKTGLLDLFVWLIFVSRWIRRFGHQGDFLKLETIWASLPNSPSAICYQHTQRHTFLFSLIRMLNWPATQGSKASLDPKISLECKILLVSRPDTTYASLPVFCNNHLNWKRSINWPKWRTGRLMKNCLLQNSQFFNHVNHVR